jgi:hypothetical protein
VPDRDGLVKACVPWSRHALRFEQSEIPGLVREIRNVLRARALFAQAAPAWAPLPVGDEITPPAAVGFGADVSVGQLRLLVDDVGLRLFTTSLIF